MRQNPLATKEFNLRPVKEFRPRNQVYFSPVHFRDHSPETLAETPLITAQRLSEQV